MIAVVSNTEHVCEDDSTRRRRDGYAVDMVEGVVAAADRTTRWFMND